MECKNIYLWKGIIKICKFGLFIELCKNAKDIWEYCVDCFWSKTTKKVLKNNSSLFKFTFMIVFYCRACWAPAFCCKLNLNAWLSLFLAYSNKSILGRYYKVFGSNTCEHIYYFIWDIRRFEDLKTARDKFIFIFRGTILCDFVEIMGLEY